jgi:hypothetical protein
MNLFGNTESFISCATLIFNNECGHIMYVHEFPPLPYPRIEKEHVNDEDFLFPRMALETNV